MAVSMRCTQGSVRGSLRVTVGQLVRGSGPKGSKIKSMSVSTSALAMGHAVGLVPGRVEAVVQEAGLRLFHFDEMFTTLVPRLSTGSREAEMGN